MDNSDAHRALIYTVLLGIVVLRTPRNTPIDYSPLFMRLADDGVFHNLENWIEGRDSIDAIMDPSYPYASWPDYMRLHLWWCQYQFPKVLFLCPEVLHVIFHAGYEDIRRILPFGTVFDTPLLDIATWDGVHCLLTNSLDLTRPLALDRWMPRRLYDFLHAGGEISSFTLYIVGFSPVSPMQFMCGLMQTETEHMVRVTSRGLFGSAGALLVVRFGRELGAHYEEIILQHLTSRMSHSIERREGYGYSLQEIKFLLERIVALTLDLLSSHPGRPYTSYIPDTLMRMTPRRLT